MACRAQLSVVTELPFYCAHPRFSLTAGHKRENANGLVREYLPRGEVIPSHQPFLEFIAEELNDRPRAILRYLTLSEYLPGESMVTLLRSDGLTQPGSALDGLSCAKQRPGAPVRRLDDSLTYVTQLGRRTRNRSERYMLDPFGCAVCAQGEEINCGKLGD